MSIKQDSQNRTISTLSAAPGTVPVMPRSDGSAAVQRTPQSADEVLTPAQVARLDADEFAELHARTLEAARRVLSSSPAPSPEMLADVRALHVAARDLAALMAWIVPVSE